MAVRDTAKQRRYNERRAIARRNVITRTSRVWTRLYRNLTRELKATASKWLKKLLTEATKESSSLNLDTLPEIPEKFTKTTAHTLREAYAYGYWLNHVYVKELKAAREGVKYRGRITLAEVPDDDEEIRRLLEEFIAYEGESWYEIIPQAAIEWLKGYVPSLAGNLNVSVLESVRSVLLGSLQEGSTLRERMKALRESVPELSAMTDLRIESIARTEITRADTLGRLTEMKSNADVIGVEFSAIMDDRTTEMCSSRHGLVMRLDDPRLPENTPPLHVRCRSLLLSCTVYDYPDGLLTSHEFDEAPSGMQRSEDIEEVLKLLS